jgi:hypothetical protein
MVRQFLLNPDGSVPAGANVARLLELGIPLVLPTPRWRPADGMMLAEGEPQQDADGIWRQVWVEVPVPASEPATDEPS